jgi:predicted transcriptional regulator
VYARNWKRKNTSKMKQVSEIMPEGPWGKVREYSSAADRMIREDLRKGWSIMQIAWEYGRDPSDIRKHIRKMGLSSNVG